MPDLTPEEEAAQAVAAGAATRKAMEEAAAAKSAEDAAAAKEAEEAAAAALTGQREAMQAYCDQRCANDRAWRAQRTRDIKKRRGQNKKTKAAARKSVKDAKKRSAPPK